MNIFFPEDPWWRLYVAHAAGDGHFWFQDSLCLDLFGFGGVFGGICPAGWAIRSSSSGFSGGCIWKGARGCCAVPLPASQQHWCSWQKQKNNPITREFFFSQPLIHVFLIGMEGSWSCRAEQCPSHQKLSWQGFVQAEPFGCWLQLWLCTEPERGTGKVGGGRCFWGNHSTGEGSKPWSQNLLGLGFHHSHHWIHNNDSDEI